MCIGGPALIYWVTPTEEELFKVRHTSFRWAFPSGTLQTKKTTDEGTYRNTIPTCRSDHWPIDKENKKILIDLSID